MNDHCLVLPAHADLFLAFLFVLHVVSKYSLTDDGRGALKVHVNISVWVWANA